MAFLHCVVISLVILIVDGFTLHCEGEIKAEVGKDVSINCSYGEDIGGGVYLTWQRVDKAATVHEYHKGNNDPADQHANYTGRTEISIQKPGTSLTLEGVRVWDGGVYKLRISTDKGFGEAHVTLVVWAMPKDVVELTQDPDKSDGLKFTCRSKGWYPEPQVYWLDRAHKVLDVAALKSMKQDSEGLYEVEHSVKTSSDPSAHYICRFKSTVVKKYASMRGVKSEGTPILLTAEDLREDL